MEKRRTWREEFLKLRTELFEEAWKWYVEMKKSEEQHGMYDHVTTYMRTIYNDYFMIILKNELYESYQEYCKNQ